MIALIRFLFSEIALSRTPLVVMSVISGLARGCLIALINAAAAAIDGGRPGVYALPFALVLAIYLAGGFYARLLSKSLVEDMTRRLRMRFSKRLLQVRADFLIGRDSGDIYTTLTQEVNRVSGASVLMLESLQAAVLVIFCVPYMAWLSPWGAFATCLTVVLGASAYFLQDRVARQLIERARRLEARFFDRVGDLLHGFKEIRLNARRADAIGGDIGRTVEKARRFTVRAERMFSVSLMTSQGFIFALLAFLVMGLPLLPGGDRTIVFQFLTVILFALSPLEMLLGNYPEIVKARVSLDRIAGLEKALDASLEAPGGGIEPAAGFNTISLRNITARLKDPAFSSSTARDIAREAFRLGPLDLDIKSGEVLFISGGNGSGKTTLLSLVCGLRRPDRGAISLDGKRVGPKDLRRYRGLFSGVFSDFHLFNTLYGLEDADPEMMAGLLQALDLDQRTGIEGSRFTTLRLSAGQKRRVALAVALIEDRPILVFDEFAADQDPAHRRYFYEELLPRLKARGKTVIAITHDETRFAQCDRLIALKSGRIAATTNGKTRATTSRKTSGKKAAKPRPAKGRRP